MSTFFHFVMHLTISLSLSTGEKRKEESRKQSKKKKNEMEGREKVFYDYRTAAFFDTRTTPRVMFIEIDSLPVSRSRLI